MNIKEAVNSPDFEILGLNAENFKRWLDFRLVELASEETKEPHIRTWQEVKKGRAHRLLLNPVRGV